MKNSVKGGLIALFMSSALWPGVDRDRALMELEEARLEAFGEKPEACLKANYDHIDEFLTAMAQVQDYIQEKGKNKLGIFDETLKKASKALDGKTKELITIVGAIHGTKTKDGLEQLKKLLKEYEERLKEHEETLGKASFDEDKKKANEVLTQVIKSVKSLLGHVTKTTDLKIKWLERPVKKDKEKDAWPVADQKQEPSADQNLAVNDKGDEQKSDKPMYQQGSARNSAQRKAVAQAMARAVWLENSGRARRLKK